MGKWVVLFCIDSKFTASYGQDRIEAYRFRRRFDVEVGLDMKPQLPVRIVDRFEGNFYVDKPRFENA